MLDCSASLKDNTLVLENSLIRRQYRWDRGDLVSEKLVDKARDITWELAGESPDVVCPGSFLGKQEADLDIHEVPETLVEPAHLLVTVTASSETLEFRRGFRLYPDCPAIACDFYVRGASAASEERAGEQEDLSPIEDEAKLGRSVKEESVLERLCLPGRHQRLTAVQFYDVTDLNNNLVQEASILAYRGERRLRGNLLFIEDLLSPRGLFVVKEAPCSNVQLAYPGHDFACKIGEVRLLGLGLDAEAVHPTEWTRCYGFVTGVTDGTEYGCLSALRSYQRRLRTHQADRDDMIMMNTWGDRGQDTRICEPFCLDELDAAARLGVSHFQLDDGWQAGRTQNSAYDGGSNDGIWNNPDFWTPHPERFPGGLNRVVERGRELGIEICLWFNPSKDEENAHWREDADALIRLHREHGIRTFKIDGVEIPTKRAEMNLRRMLDAVMEATGGTGVFNLDGTAGRRFGYHYFREYGNVFLENRYTDWSNYHPHWTLRNLWMLSRYVPAPSLQIEFLNKWRNEDNYDADDPLAPARVPFDYVFAITMMAQPLAWFEGTGLPEEAFEIAPMVRTYREHQSRIHEGLILPIGQEPSGTGWTGFQSIRGDGGYLLVFREHNDLPGSRINLWGLAGREVTCRAILGHGADFSGRTGEAGSLMFCLPRPHSFVLYEYESVDV